MLALVGRGTMPPPLMVGVGVGERVDEELQAVVRMRISIRMNNKDRLVRLCFTIFLLCIRDSLLL